MEAADGSAAQPCASQQECGTFDQGLEAEDHLKWFSVGANQKCHY